MEANINMETLLEEAAKMITTFYTSQRDDERQQAHQWLLQLQQSNHAWQVACTLTKSGGTFEMQYYGCNILHYKVSKHWSDVVDNMNELKGMFKELLIKFCQGPKVIRTKLCLAFAAFIIQAAEEDWNLGSLLQEVESWIKEQNLDSKEITLELLASLPSEMKSLHLAKSRRQLVYGIFRAFIPKLLDMSQAVLQNSNEPTSCKGDVLKCLSIWVQFGVTLSEMEGMVSFLFSKIGEPDLSDQICEVLIELITSPSSYNCSIMILNFMKLALSLDSLVYQSINNKDNDMINNLCLLFTSIGETHCRLFVKSNNSEYQTALLNYVKILLHFTAIKGYHPVDETCSEQTFTFWYTLQDDITSLEPHEVTDFHHSLNEVYMALIQILCKKVQYPPDDVYNQFDSDEKERFRCYRIDIQDTIMYVYNLVQEKCIQYLADHLHHLLSGMWLYF